MRYDKIKEFQADFSQEAVFKISQMTEKGDREGVYKEA